MANQRRRTLRRILASKDKMGLTNVGLKQLKSFIGKETEPAKRPAMDDLEQSAAKVLDSLSAEGFNELLAWSDARKLGQGPKKETVLKDSTGKQEGWAIKEEGEEVKDLKEGDDDDDNDDDEEEEEEEDGGLMTPVPVTP
ncbi:hypothetical protein MMC22_007583 [Lobaria immixta]|nr:hypothetical protein [Lobaria immixta]